jgi:uncharacterized glyoxalase superfamily protein PhnB
MKPPPRDWPRLSSSVFYQDAQAAIDWLCRHLVLRAAQGRGEGGRIEHSELTYGEGLVMVGQEGGSSAERPWKARMRSPRSVDGANTQCLMLFVDDADAHCAHARQHGAQIVEEPATHDYGDDYWADRSYGALDPEGHLWWITQRVRDPVA